MRRLSVVGAIIGSFLLGAAMTAVAQEENKQEEHKNEKQEAKPPRQEQAKPEEHKNQEPKQDQRQQPSKQDERQMKQQQEQQKMDKQQEKQQEKMDKQQGREQERQQQAPTQPPIEGGQQQAHPQHAQNQRHISDHDFHAHFGREHRFSPGHMQVYAGRPSFSYSGYVFELVDVWPMDWAYDSDDYYVDYFDDEYWLCSFSHPDIRLELIIVG